MSVIHCKPQGEREAILAWAGHRVGSFIDFGCYDPFRFSNTGFLAERGWGGICIDAAPDAAAACAIQYADRDDITVMLGAFAVDEPATVTIHWSPGFMYSSRQPNLRSDITLAPLDMAPLNLAALGARLEELDPPLFCSIDLEGSSLDALRWLLDVASPDCVCVEANNSDDRATVRGWLVGWDEVPVNDHNLVLARQ